MLFKSNILVVVLSLHILDIVTLSSCEVAWVKRNVIDSFFVGKDGCKKNQRICTTRSALCQADASCLCSSSKPTFRNPVIKVNSGKTVYGNNSFGCVKNEYLRLGVGK